MSRIVIVCYKPKPGHELALKALLLKHIATLRSIELVTDRSPITMQAIDGTYVEVFEWASAQAIETAHQHPIVQKMWEEFEGVCEYVPISQVAEASKLFSNFTPIKVDS